jgi:ATP-dependent helicase/nuclease subunit A
MAAVTFTRKAAAELKSRFRIKLEECVRSESGPVKDNLEKALQNMEQCFIGTIHSFCGHLLRERPVEAGVDPTFQELDEDADAILRKEAWLEYSSRLLAEDNEGFLPELEKFALRVQDLEETFVRFSNYPDVSDWPSPEGKPDFSLLDPVREQIFEYVAHMRSLASRLPQQWGNDNLIPKYRRAPRILSHYGSLEWPADVIAVLENFDADAKITLTSWTQDGLFTKDEAKTEQARWKEFRSNVVEPALKRWREWRYGPILRVMIRAQSVYDEMRHSRGQLNYTDLLMRAAQLLRENSHVRSYFRDRFTHLLVDEFQDTDPIQAEVILLLTTSNMDEKDWRKVVPRPGSLFVVGDPKQSIYRFRRADIVTYNEVKEAIRKGNTQNGRVIELSSNFRTVDGVISWVNHVFEPQDGSPSELSGTVVRFDKSDSPESPRYVGLDPSRSDSADGTLKGVYSLTIPKECDNKQKVLDYEADWIARTIRRALDDSDITIPRTKQEIMQGKTGRLDPSDFLIINRNKGLLSFYAGKLEEYGIPTHVSGGSALNEVRELKILHSCLDALVRPDDPVALLAVLRGELFGMSDVSLYEFKKAGGRFSFHSEVPERLDPEVAGQFSDAFSRMKSYSLWLSRMPPLAAFDRIVADLGLLALSAIRPGGSVQAGSFSKAIEILRGFQHDTWTTAQIVEQLGRLSQETTSHDGISASSKERPAVRIMNLHKVKGLEAPVVFLACPYGESDHDVELHIDRSGNFVRGYLGVYGKKSGHKRPFLAHPANWSEFTDRESRFLKAESLRLRYVAATRAGAALIITKRESGRGESPWKPFHRHLSADREIHDFSQTQNPPKEMIEVTMDEVAKAQEDIESRITLASKPTYDACRAKEFALRQGRVTSASSESLKEDNGLGAEADADDLIDDGEHGVEWGTLIHSLLQLAMENPQADLKRAFKAALDDHDPLSKYAELAETTVKKVMGSDLWIRAQQSESRLLEVPFQVLKENVTETGDMLPTIFRGTIDLIFKESTGWILVDYKTDMVIEETAQRIVDKYTPQLQIYSEAWQECTGEPVVETGLYLVRLNKYVRVQC